MVQIIDSEGFSTIIKTLLIVLLVAASTAFAREGEDLRRQFSKVTYEAKRIVAVNTPVRYRSILPVSMSR